MLCEVLRYLWVFVGLLVCGIGVVSCRLSLVEFGRRARAMFIG